MRCGHMFLSFSCSVMSYSWQHHGLQLARLLCHGILQARILEQVAMPSSKGSSQPIGLQRVGNNLMTEQQQQFLCIKKILYTDKPNYRFLVKHSSTYFLYLFLSTYLLGCAWSQLQRMGSLVAACGIQFPEQGLNLGPLALGARSLSHWTTRELPQTTYDQENQKENVLPPFPVLTLPNLSRHMLWYV